MPDLFDTPSTDGAPDPEEVIAAIADTVGVPDDTWHRVEHAAARFDIELAKRDLRLVRVVPEDRPAQCPNCGSTDPRKVGIRPASPLTGDGAYSVAFSEVCSDPWHAPAGVPVLDDDTRREVEALIVMLTQNSFHLTQTEMNRIAELLADAYFGGTDGR